MEQATPGVHTVIAGPRGIDVDTSGSTIVVASTSQLLAYLCDDEAWALNHTIAHHADEVRRPDYLLKIESPQRWSPPTLALGRRGSRH